MEIKTESKFRKYFFVFVVILIPTFLVRAQTASAPRIIPPTPNVASLAKYGDVPFGLFTGQPNVSFPLYEISYPDFSMPISLSYNNNGLKVEEYPGWVGAGWTLQATGVITRQTRGLPDERVFGYNGQGKKGLEIVSFINSRANKFNPTYYNLLQSIKDNLADPEPDIFVLSAPGLSCKFYFDETQCNSLLMEGTLVIKKATVMPDKKITVKGFFDYNAKYGAVMGIIKKFEITDEKGIVYLFDVLEKADGYKYDVDNTTPTIDEYGNAWYLSQITTPLNNTINFQYKYRTIDNPPTVYEELLIPDDFHTTPKYHMTSTVEAILDKITFRNGSIDFIENLDSRLDWDSQSWFYSKKQATIQPKALALISISEEGRSVKSISFQYSYFTKSSLPARLRLDSFKENQTPPHIFEYELGDVPRIGVHEQLFQQDHWGYYTGTNYQTLLTPFFATATLGSSSNIPISLTGNTRIPQPNFSKAGLLKKITYPTKGFTQFSYEPNDFYSAQPILFVPPKTLTDFGTASATTNLFIGQIEDRKTFTLTRKTFGSVTFTAQLSNCGEASAYVYIRDHATADTKVAYTLTRLGGQVTSVPFGPGIGELFSLEPGTYDLVAGASIESSCSVALTQPSSASINYSGLTGDEYVAGGFRVSKMEDCTVEGCLTKYFDYRTPGTTNTSGVLINTPSYARQVYVRTRIGGELINLLSVYLYSSSIIPVASEQGGVMGYKYVTETRDLSGASGKTVHKFTTADEHPDFVFYSFPVKPRSDNGNKRGAEVERKDYTSGGSILNEQINSYETANGSFKTIGLSVGPIVINADNAQSTGLEQVDFWLKFAEVYDREYVPYDLIADSFRPKYETITTYSGTSNLSSLTTKYYDNPLHNQLTRSETTGSDGSNIVTTLSYPDDVNNLSGLTPPEISGLQSMPNKVAVVEKKVQKNGLPISSVRNLYNGPLLSKAMQSDGAGSFQDNFIVEQYSPYGNIRQYKTRSETISVLYGYSDKLPIAEVRNATSNEIFHTSFEVGEEGGNSTDGDSRTGLKSLIGIYSKTVTKIPNKAYVLTYWQKLNNVWTPQTLNIPPSIETTFPITLGGQVDEVRFFPQGALMNTYTYKPGVGITSMCDPKGLITTYEYDTMNRLWLVKDHFGKIVKEHKYNYKQ